jgi:phosphate-selective porin
LNLLSGYLLRFILPLLNINYMKLNLSLLIVGLFLTLNIRSQEAEETPLDTLARSVRGILDEMNKAKRLKITGYVQPQFQYIDSAGAPSVAGGDFVSPTGNAYFSRFTMRRGRFKFTYTYENTMVMVNTDVTERGVFMRETYAKISDPWLNMFSLTAGLLQDQFGFELTQSSSERETPERARYNQTLFPTERDLGVFGSVVFPKSMPSLYGLKIDLGLMNGSAGVQPEFDNQKDMTARLQYAKTSKNEKISYAVAGSYYNGGYKIGKQKDYVFTTLSNGDKGYDFASDTGNYSRLGQRIYYGADFQVSLDWKIGITTIRGEYITGEHAGTDKSNRSPSALPTSPIYHRKFDGAYFYLIQNIGQSRFQVVAKYDWYDPNTQIAGEDIGKTGTKTNVGDIRFDTYGAGITCRINHNLKIMAYYDYVINEKTMVTGYKGDIKDNVLTIRMQMKY